MRRLIWGFAGRIYHIVGNLILFIRVTYCATAQGVQISFLSSGNFCLLLDPDQDRQKVGSDLDPKSFDTDSIHKSIFEKKIVWKKSADDIKNIKKYPACKKIQRRQRVMFKLVRAKTKHSMTFVLQSIRTAWASMPLQEVSLGTYLITTHCAWSQGSDQTGWIARLVPSKQLKPGHHRPSSKTPFELRFAGRRMVARDWLLAGSYSSQGAKSNFQTVGVVMCRLTIFKPLNMCKNILLTAFRKWFHWNNTQHVCTWGEGGGCTLSYCLTQSLIHDHSFKILYFIVHVQMPNNDSCYMTGENPVSWLAQFVFINLYVSKPVHKSILHENQLELVSRS